MRGWCALLTVACSSSSDDNKPAPPPQPVGVDVKFETRPVPPGLEVRIGGTVAREFEGRWSGGAPVTGNGIPNVTARITDSPCGPFDLPVKVERSEDGRYDAVVDPAGSTTVQIIVDNRDQGARELVLGTMRLDLTKEPVAETRVALGADCRPAVEVDGRRLGPMPDHPRPGKEGAAPAVLIDPLATACYMLWHQAYSTNLTPRAGDPPSSGFDEVAPAGIHAFDAMIDYPFTETPKVVEVPAGGASRTVLTSLSRMTCTDSEPKRRNR
jgi:hypothetical protein